MCQLVTMYHARGNCSWYWHMKVWLQRNSFLIYRGQLKIAEVASRFQSLPQFLLKIEQFGFNQESKVISCISTFWLMSYCQIPHTVHLPLCVNRTESLKFIIATLNFHAFFCRIHPTKWFTFLISRRKANQKGKPHY